MLIRLKPKKIEYKAVFTAMSECVGQANKFTSMLNGDPDTIMPFSPIIHLEDAYKIVV